MKSQTLKPLLKLRKHQVEMERWKLASLQAAEQDAQSRVLAVESALRKAYDQASGCQRPAEVMNAASYLADANILLGVEKKNLVAARQQTEKQLECLVEVRRREQMMEKLHDAAVEAERAEQQAKERKELDDLNQSRHALKERKLL